LHVRDFSISDRTVPKSHRGTYLAFTDRTVTWRGVDYVLTGGELAAQALIDASVRLIPRVLGNQASTEEESFSDGLLEHPQYTKPAVWEGRAIPDILLSGHHARIADWRRDMAERLTKERRPDLWRAYCARHGRDPDEDREL